MPDLTSIRWRLQTWLMALSFMAVLPLLLFSAFILNQLKEQQKHLLEQDLRHRTEDIARVVEERVNVAVSVLRSLAESDAARHNDMPALYAQAKRIVEGNPAFRAVTLVDAQGRMYFHTTLPYGGPTFAAHDLALIRRAIETGQPNVSGPFVAPISPKIVAAVSVPIVVDGKSNRCLRLILLSDSLSQLLTQQDLPPGWVARIVDRQGFLVGRTQHANKFVGKPAEADLLAAIRRGDQQPFEDVTLDGIPTTSLLVPIHNGDWHLGVGVPSSILNAPLYELLREMAVLAVIWLTASFLVARALAHYLAKQTRAVANAIMSNADSLPARHTIRVEELWSIFQSFLETKRHEVAARSDLKLVATQRDEVQDLYEHAPCGYHSLDKDGRVVQINQTELLWLGRSKEEVIGQPFLTFFTEASQAAFRQHFPEFLKYGQIRDLEFELVRKDGSTMPVLVSATAIKDQAGQLVMSRTTMFDITERKQLERELDRLARTDPLTGLSNRRDFYTLAERELARSRRFNAPLSLFMLDIDHFKDVNDRYGHAAGDEVLRRLSQTCRGMLRETDVLARIGGEEFAVLMPETTLEQSFEVADKLRTRLADTPIVLPDAQSISFTVSIGISHVLATDTDIDMMLKRADAALYQAKNSGRNQVCSRGDPVARPESEPAAS